MMILRFTLPWVCRSGVQIRDRIDPDEGAQFMMKKCLIHSMRRRVAWMFAAGCMIMCASALAAGDAMDRARLEKMLADGDAGMIAQVFKRHPGQTLPFID